jgi:hypothetical protein
LNEYIEDMKMKIRE